MQIEVIIEKKSHKLDAEEGKTILETLQEHGIHVLTAPCGGRGRCGKCTVEVEHMGEVLACMTKVTDGMRITIPKVQLRAQKSKIAENGTVTHYPADDGEGQDAACDIGTTTVVCHLIDGKTGEKLATVSEPSAQRSFGADVLSRIQAAEAGKLEILKEQIIFQIAQMLRTLQKNRERGTDSASCRGGKYGNVSSVCGNFACFHRGDAVYAAGILWKRVYRRAAGTYGLQIGIHSTGGCRICRRRYYFGSFGSDAEEPQRESASSGYWNERRDGGRKRRSDLLLCHGGRICI